MTTDKIVRETIASGAVSSTGGKYRITVIKPGQGSSGYYPADVLERDAPSVFPVGTKIYADHPTEQEMWDQPERTVTKIIGKTTSAAEWNPAANEVQADVYFGSAYLPVIEEFHDVMGMSIRAKGVSEITEVDGVMVDKVTALVPTRGTSIDLVTEAGAGGKILQRIESARLDAVTSPPVPVGSSKRGSNMELSKEDFDASNAALATAIVSGVSAALTEALKPKEAAPVNPVNLGFALAEALTEAKLGPEALTIVKSMTEAGVSAVDAITQVKKLTESISTSEVPGKGTQTGTSGGKSLFDGIVGGFLTEAGQSDEDEDKKLSESWADEINRFVKNGSTR